MDPCDEAGASCEGHEDQTTGRYLFVFSTHQGKSVEIRAFLYKCFVRLIRNFEKYN